jgi:hypothetical protein
MDVTEKLCLFLRAERDAVEIMNVEDQILNALEFNCGRAVGDIAQSTGITFGHSRRTTSSYLTQKLVEMEKQGLVRRMDHEKPIAWVRTDKTGGSRMTARKPTFAEPDAVSDPLGWRKWWIAQNPGKTWDDASAAWAISVK